MTDSDLFDLPPCDSPRLRWMKNHGLKTVDGGKDVQTGKRWYCHRPECKNEFSGSGDTEDEAIFDWAKVNRVRLWNEGGL